MERDKVIHSGVSAGIVIITAIVFSHFGLGFGSVVFGALLAVGFGILKEFWDIFIEKECNTTYESMRDLFANFAGIAIGILLSFIVLWGW